MDETGGIVVTASVGTLVAQVTELVDMKAVFLCYVAREAFQIHFYRYVASFLHNSCMGNQSSQ